MFNSYRQIICRRKPYPRQQNPQELYTSLRQFFFPFFSFLGISITAGSHQDNWTTVKSQCALQDWNRIIVVSSACTKKISCTSVANMTRVRTTTEQKTYQLIAWCSLGSNIGQVVDVGASTATGIASVAVGKSTLPTKVTLACLVSTVLLHLLHINHDKTIFYSHTAIKAPAFEKLCSQCSYLLSQLTFKYLIFTL